MCRIILWHFNCENCYEYIRSESEDDACDIALGLVDGICLHLLYPTGRHRALLVRRVLMEREQCATCKDSDKEEKNDIGNDEEKDSDKEEKNDIGGDEEKDTGKDEKKNTGKNKEKNTGKDEEEDNGEGEKQNNS